MVDWRNVALALLSPMPRKESFLMDFGYQSHISCHIKINYNSMYCRAAIKTFLQYMTVSFISDNEIKLVAKELNTSYLF